MLIYNITFHLETKVEKNFLIWLKEAYIIEVERYSLFENIRLCKILSHHEEDQAAYSLQWSFEKTADLHHWHLEHGTRLNQEIKAIFKDKVLGIPTLMEEV